MADDVLDLRPPQKKVKFRRGDVVAFDVVIYDTSVSPRVVLLGLTTEGWRAQVRAEAGESTEPPLASFVIDSSEVDTTGKLHMVLEAADALALPEESEFDVENTIIQRTCAAGTLEIEGQVSQ
jgi:hypothetical protein